MLEVLRQAAAEVGNTRVIPIGYAIHSQEEAQRVSDIYKSTMVVYGRTAPGGVTAHYEITPRFSEVGYQVEGDFRVSRADVPNYDVFLFNGLDANYIVGLTMGQFFYFDDDYERAILSFSRAIGWLDKNSERAAELQAEVLFIFRGLAYYDQGKLDEAMVDYTRAIDLKPDYTNAFWGRGNVYYDLHDYPQALTDYREYERLTGKLESFMQERIAEMEAILSATPTP